MRSIIQSTDIDLSAYQPLSFTNNVINTVDWLDNATTPDTGFEDYAYKAIITCNGVTSSMYSTIVYYDAQNGSGMYSRTGSTGTDTVTVYSNDNSTITIPTIIAGNALLVKVHDTVLEDTIEAIVGGTE